MQDLVHDVERPIDGVILERLHVNLHLRRSEPYQSLEVDLLQNLVAVVLVRLVAEDDLALGIEEGYCVVDVEVTMKADANLLVVGSISQLRYDVAVTPVDFLNGRADLRLGNRRERLDDKPLDVGALLAVQFDEVNHVNTSNYE